MAAGPYELARQYKETLNEIDKKLDLMKEGLDYAPGFDLIEVYDEYNEIYYALQRIRNDVDYIRANLDNIQSNLVDKTYEELVENAEVIDTD